MYSSRPTQLHTSAKHAVATLLLVGLAPLSLGAAEEDTVRSVPASTAAPSATLSSTPWGWFPSGRIDRGTSNRQRFQDQNRQESAAPAPAQGRTPSTSVSNNSSARFVSSDEVSILTRQDESSAEALPLSRTPVDEIMIDPGYYNDLGIDAGTCNNPSCGSCSPWFVNADALLWWTDSMQTPPLVTSSPPNTPRAQAGVLGLPSTNILFGGPLNDDARAGGRFGVGYWLTPCDLALEVSYLFLEQESSNFAANQQTNPILARPFFNAETNAEAAELVAFPGLLDGSVTVSSSTEFDALDVTLKKNLCCQCDYRLVGEIGYRYASLTDQLRITESLVSLDAASGTAPGTTIDLFDHFGTRNEFQGATLGVSGEYRHCQWTLEVLMKLGLGNTRSDVVIDGETTITTVGPTTGTNPGGLLAQPTNIGNFRRDDFTMIPELGAQLHYEINPCWRASIGYTFLYWSNVARAGDQIDPMLNLSQLPPGPLTGAPLPRFRYTSSDFWAQGLNFGLEFRH